MTNMFYSIYLIYVHNLRTNLNLFIYPNIVFVLATVEPNNLRNGKSRIEYQSKQKKTKKKK